MFSRSMTPKEGKSIWSAKPKFHFLWFNQFSLSLSIAGAVLFIGIWAENDFQWSWYFLALPCILCVLAMLMPLWSGLFLIGTRYMLTEEHVLIIKNYIFFRRVYSLPLKNIWSVEVCSKNGEVSVFWGLYERWWSGLIISSSIQRKNEEFRFVFLRESDWTHLRDLIPKRISIKFLCTSKK